MAKSKLIVADPKNGKSIMYELTDDQFRVFKGLKIGSDIDGSPVNVIQQQLTENYRGEKFRRL